MNGMFAGCSSLTKINLSNFNTNKVIDMSNILYGTYILKRENVISTDNKILKEFDASHRQAHGSSTATIISLDQFLE